MKNIRRRLHFSRASATGALPLQQESKHRRSPVKFAEVDFDPQDTTSTSNDMMTKLIKCREEVPTIVTAKIEEVNLNPQDTSGRVEDAGEVLQHLLYSDKSGWLPWPKQHEDDDSSDYSGISSAPSYEDNDCGWLPWPGQRYDDSCNINSSISGSRSDDECSKYSKNEGNTLFLLRPGTPFQNERASAA